MAGMAETWRTPTVSNKPKTYIQISLKKVDAQTNVSLAGAVFTHTLPDGTTETLTTGSNGELTFTGIPGTHYFDETKAPDGYLPLNRRITVVVGSNGFITSVTNAEQTGTSSFVVDDEKIGIPEFSILIKKTDEDGKPLAGATFSIAYPSTIADSEAPSGADDETSDASSSETEDKTSDQSESISSQASSDSSEIEEMESENARSDDSSQLQQRDAASESEQSGSEKASKMMKTDANGEIRLNNLTPGTTYTIKEIMPPEGYELPEPNNPTTIDVTYNQSTSKFTVMIDGQPSNDYTVNSDGSITVTITRINKLPGSILPDTGSFWTIMLLATGLALAVYGTVRNRKQQS